MDAEIKRKWITALRSGDYKQGRGSLEAHNTFCCLGVLCLIQDQQPADLYPHCGLRVFQCENLADMNDSGKSFTEIADYIEAKL